MNSSTRIGLVVAIAALGLGSACSIDNSDAIEEAIESQYAEDGIEVTGVEMAPDEDGDGYSGTATVIDPGTGQETELTCTAVPAEGSTYDWNCNV
ncbi:MAG: hypothetical protein RLN87_01550 [Parasphingopyxis sp.]|uniref:hypothetical protein n=1 Tax=Parasphingopyxis sp. TaxID=1920299 RepID=UPI002609F27C|nr:hypothetical protein [uncultured Parasphingopyxis sp.]